MSEPRPIVRSWEEVAQEPLEPVPFYLEHYIPKEGIVLLHGKYGTYKTPLTVQMARSIATGQTLFGMEVTPAFPILYIQGDSAESVIKPRLQEIGLNIGPGLADFAFCYPGFDVVNEIRSKANLKIYTALREAHEERQYRAVFIDSLRIIHTLKDTDSESVTQVYGAIARLFTGAVVILIHHDKKTKIDSEATGREREELSNESFSGSQAWANHATVALKLEHRNRRRREVALIHHKSQAGPLQPPLIIRANEGATGFEVGTSIIPAEFLNFLKLLPDSMSNHEKDLALAEKFGCSTRTAQRKRLEAATCHDKPESLGTVAQEPKIHIVKG